MFFATILLGLYLALSLLYWSWIAYAMFRSRRAAPMLGSLASPEPAEWPHLTVVVPARDEAEHIEPAARTLLEEDYPNLEIIFVDDRSTDATGAIIDRLVAASDRARAIHVTELPAGWLGKVNALNRGLQESSGEFVLFTDADVHFARGTLRRAVAHMLAERLDHLVAVPRILPTSLVVDASVSCFLRQFVAGVRAWAVPNPRSRAYLGIGAFNMVRRAAFEATEGFEWLRMEMGDDMGVGLLMKRAGHRTGVVSAFRHVGVQWLRSYREAVRSSEKGYAAVCRFSVVRAAILALVTMAVELSPAVAPLMLIPPATRVLGYAALAVTATFLAGVWLLLRWYPARLPATLLSPLLSPVTAMVIIRTAVVGKRRGGAVWRGTLYSEAELREGIRIRFP